MDSKTGDLDTDEATGSVGETGVPASPDDDVQQALAPGVGLDPVGPGPERATGWRQRGLRPLLFVLVLTGVVMAFAIIVAVWMYWLAPALAA